MAKADSYVDLEGRTFDLQELDAEERKLVERLRRRARTHPDWNDFENYWTNEVAELYDRRGISRRKARQSAVYRIAQDLGDRIGIASGLVRKPGYRDELEELIHSRFKTRREFCQATGISEDMLSHVLAGRKNIAIDTLEEALSRIGCRLHIAPLEAASSKE